MFRIAILSALSLLPAGLPAQQERYSLTFSTYLGGSDWEHARDMAVGRDGSIVVVGGTASEDFPTTPGAFQRKRAGGGSAVGSGGQCDVFVTKYSPDGKIVWSTYLGGPNYDRAYAVEIDAKGFIYVAGRAGPGFPVTRGVFQEKFRGTPNEGHYGAQNCFVTKLSPAGQPAWASYAGIGCQCRDLALDREGSLYLVSGSDGSKEEPQAEWYANAFQKVRHGLREMGFLKVSNDGRRVIWATWLGGSGEDATEVSVRVDSGGSLFLTGHTDSPDMPTTPGAYSRKLAKGTTDYLARLSPDGSKLLYGTYLTASLPGPLGTHNLAIDGKGNAFVALGVGPDFPTTAGVFRKDFKGGKNDWGVAQVGPAGEIVRATFIGGSGDDNPDGIAVDPAGNVFITGETASTDFPVTKDAFQPVHHGGRDIVVAMLSADFTSLLYSTFLGGSDLDSGRANFLDGDGNLYVTGSTNSKDWPTKNAAQTTFAGGTGAWGNGEVIVAKFTSRRAPSQSRTRRSQTPAAH